MSDTTTTETQLTSFPTEMNVGDNFICESILNNITGFAFTAANTGFFDGFFDIDQENMISLEKMYPTQYKNEFNKYLNEKFTDEYEDEMNDTYIWCSPELKIRVDDKSRAVYIQSFDRNLLQRVWEATIKQYAANISSQIIGQSQDAYLAGEDMDDEEFENTKDFRAKMSITYTHTFTLVPKYDWMV